MGGQEISQSDQGGSLSRRAALGLGAGVVATGVLARNSAAQETDKGPLTTQDISLAQAQAVVDAAIAAAVETDTLMDIAVVDAGGNLKAFARMDGAWLGSIDIAIKKAKTARYFDFPTGAWRAQPTWWAALPVR